MYIIGKIKFLNELHNYNNNFAWLMLYDMVVRHTFNK